MSTPTRAVPAFVKPHREALGRRLRAARERQHFSQERLGEATGVDRKTVNRIENGHISPSYDLLIDFARVLDIKLAWLIDSSGAEG